MTPSDAALATDSEAWNDLEMPLTLHELTRLSHLQLKIAAAVHLADHGQAFSFRDAKRLGWARWLFLTRRISEFS